MILCNKNCNSYRCRWRCWTRRMSWIWDSPWRFKSIRRSVIIASRPGASWGRRGMRRFLAHFEKKKHRDFSFSSARRKEVKEASTPDQTYPLYGTGLTAPPVAQTFLRPFGSKRRKASSEGKLRPSKVWLFPLIGWRMSWNRPFTKDDCAIGGEECGDNDKRSAQGIIMSRRIATMKTWRIKGIRLWWLGIWR